MLDKKQTIKASDHSVAAGRDVNITNGFSLEDLSKFLLKRESEVREELTLIYETQLSNARELTVLEVKKRKILEVQLQEIQKAFENLEDERQKVVDALTQAKQTILSFEGKLPEDRIADAYAALDEGPLAAANAFSKIADEGSLELVLAAMEAAHLYRSIFRYEDAVRYYKKAIALDEGNAAIHNSLAMVYMDMGLYEEAERFFLKAIDLSRKHDIEYATCVNNLGTLYELLGDYDNALLRLKDAWKIRKQELERNHPFIASSLNNIGNVLVKLGRFPEAEKCFDESLKIYRSMRVDPELGRASTLNNLADLYRIQHRFDEAEPMLLESRTYIEENFGENHPYTATAITNLAGLYKETGRTVDAEPLFQRALEIRKSTYGENHPSVAESLNNLGGIYEEIGNIANKKNDIKACELAAKNVFEFYKRALDIQMKVLGENHPETAKTMQNMASFLRLVGNLERSEELFFKALPVLKYHLGERHLNIAFILNNIALLREAQGRRQDAEKFATEAVDIASASLGIDHPLAAMMKETLRKIRSGI